MADAVAETSPRAERREAIVLALHDDTWRTRTNGWIAEHLGVDRKEVWAVRAELEASGSINGERFLRARDGRLFEVTPERDRTAPCPGCGLLVSVGCTCGSKRDPDAPPSFAPPADDRWWDCPRCATTYSRSSSEGVGWCRRGFCGVCAGEANEGGGS